MTRKDYIKIAKILNDTMAPARVVDAFTTMLQTDNERFNASTFKNASDSLIESAFAGRSIHRQRTSGCSVATTRPHPQMQDCIGLT